MIEWQNRLKSDSKRTLKMKNVFFILTILLIPLLSFSQVEVAFIEMRDPQGKLIEFEKDARFSHVAISYHRHWLHTHPFRGVEVVDQKTLEEIGLIVATLLIGDHDEPSDVFVKSIIGSPYESKFSWDSKLYYCSKLVGQFFGLNTEPMDFNAPIWPLYFRKYNGLPGLSPQGAYRQLVKRGYPVRWSSPSCRDIFSHQ